MLSNTNVSEKRTSHPFHASPFIPSSCIPGEGQGGGLLSNSRQWRHHISLACFLTFLMIGCARNKSQPEMQSPNDHQFVAVAGIHFFLVHPGQFWMGSPATEKDRFDNELRHPVTISKPFYLAATPVTVKQFNLFTTETGFKTAAEREGWAYGSWNLKENKWDKLQAAAAPLSTAPNIAAPPRPQQPRLPKFLHRLPRRNGRRVRSLTAIFRAIRNTPRRQSRGSLLRWE
jgi:formylglycine-generating enzyme required for sulfatase activity